ncbi:hypothetical protein N9903_00965, partial [bacterium]|nr:hypothetical protein [bacterium]
MRAVTKRKMRGMKMTQGTMSKRFFLVLAVCTLVVGSVVPLAAQDTGDKHSADAAAANNPLANMTSFQFNDYYAPDLYGHPDEVSNTAWLRFVHPFGKWLV